MIFSRLYVFNILKGIPDDNIKELNWQKIVGHYLLKAKYFYLKKMERKIILTDNTEIDAIETHLFLSCIL